MIAAALLLALQAAPATAVGGDYDRGVAARLAGETDLAIELLERAVEAEPRNADARLQYGLALLAAGHLDEAERALRTTLAIAPGYEDARIALARLYHRRGDRAAAEAELAQVSPSNAEAADLRDLIRRPVDPTGLYRAQMDLDGSYSWVGSGQPDWRDVALRVGYAIDPATEIASLVETSRRFGRDDVYGELQVRRRMADGSHVWLLAGGTPSADFRPEWQVGAGGAFKLSQGPTATVATVDARHARYPGGNIQILNPGLEQYLRGGHWLTARLINVFGGGRHQMGWFARADAMAAPRLRLFAGASDAPDLSEGVVVRTFSLFGGAAVAVSDRTSLRLTINRERREGSADRLEVATGVGFRF